MKPNGVRSTAETLPDLVCLSHLRWNFVFQRPQHLMSRFAKERRVFFVEEPLWGPGPTRLDVHRAPEGVYVVTPHIQATGAVHDEAWLTKLQRQMLEQLLDENDVRSFVLWFYTPMALAFARELEPVATIYDCMDELSHFQGAPPALLALEAELFRRADVVFTGGVSLFEAKRNKHANVHPFPSSVDVPHFAQARAGLVEPADQASLARPRMGFCGVIDERMNLELVAGVARERPDWQLVMVGPVVKISPESLPRSENLHYLGGKSYPELPHYLGGWDVALMPFALNDSTRYISPTKTPEYLAAGKPVVSTSIRDVVRPYGEQQLVRIADSVPTFIDAIQASLSEAREPWLARVDRFLAHLSWDETWRGMKAHVDAAGPRSHHSAKHRTDEVTAL